MSVTVGDNTESDNAGQAGPELMECPYCKERIRADAVTCRFCTRDLHDPNAARLVLDETAWNTEVPEWMREAERKALARRLLLRKLRRDSWKIVAGALAPVVLVILWRVTHMPPDPHEAAWQEAAQRQHRSAQILPPLEVRNAIPPKIAPVTPTPTATPEVASPAPAAIATPSSIPQEIATPSATEQIATSATDTAPLIGASTSSLPAYDMPANDLAREFLRTRQIAEDRYVGETIRVTGTVHNIDTTGNVPTFLLGDEKPFVKCLLPAGSRQALAGLRSGTQASVHGRCDGAFVEILLSDCTIE